MSMAPQPRLPAMRVRFAPSPTGALHIGGARTALYNWLAARHAGGTFVLRIEDTDRDLIRGETPFQNVHMDDPVIARADGTPLYNLAVAVDDLDAAITHVIRGDDHYSNTPKQLLVLQALGAEQPVYAHLPLLHGPDG